MRQQRLFASDVEDFKSFLYLVILLILFFIALLMMPSEPNNRLPQTSAAAEGAK